MGEATAERYWLFGSGHPDRDPAANGAKGGRAPRRSATVAAAKRNVLGSRSGAANYALLQMELRRQQVRDSLVYRKDRELLQMDEMLADARDELRALDEQAEQRRAQLEAARSDPALLVEFLRSCGEQRVEAACVALGWVESESDALVR